MQEDGYEDDEFEMNKTSDPGRKKLRDDDYDHVSHEHTHSNSSDDEENKKGKKRRSKSKSKLPPGTNSQKKLGGKGGFELQ